MSPLYWKTSAQIGAEANVSSCLSAVSLNYCQCNVLTGFPFLKKVQNTIQSFRKWHFCCSLRTMWIHIAQAEYSKSPCAGRYATLFTVVGNAGRAALLTWFPKTVCHCWLLRGRREAVGSLMWFRCNSGAVGLASLLYL